jgi:rod shape-determining protein MreD
MAYLISIPVLVFLTILQSAVFNDLTLLDGRVDLILLFVVSWGINGRPREAMIFALMGGLFLDLLSGLPMGISSIILITITYFVSFTEGRFWEANFLMPMGVMLGATLVYHFLELLILLLLGKLIPLDYALLRIILPSSFLNLILALPAVQVIKSAINSIYPPEVKI